MEKIGIFDLKTHLSQIIDRVIRGEEFLVTNRGEVVAMLTLPENKIKQKQGLFLKELQEKLKQAPLANDLQSLQNMIREGRK